MLSGGNALSLSSTEAPIIIIIIHSPRVCQLNSLSVKSRKHLCNFVACFAGFKDSFSKKRDRQEGELLKNDFLHDFKSKMFL